jgi:hypothetical protein
MTNFLAKNIAHYDESREFTFNDFTSEAFKAGRKEIEIKRVVLKDKNCAPIN